MLKLTSTPCCRAACHAIVFTLSVPSVLYGYSHACAALHMHLPGFHTCALQNTHDFSPCTCSHVSALHFAHASFAFHAHLLCMSFIFTLVNAKSTTYSQLQAISNYSQSLVPFCPDKREILLYFGFLLAFKQHTTT